MDQKKIETLQSKLKVLSHDERCGCIYQWILTKHIRLPEFIILSEWCQENRPPEPVISTGSEDTPDEAHDPT